MTRLAFLFYKIADFLLFLTTVSDQRLLFGKSGATVA